MTKPLAKQLLARFGGFAAVLNADISALTEIDGVKENTAARSSSTPPR